VSTLVGILGWLLTDDRRVAGLAVLVFALHSCHSTVVMWIASANELLAGAFALGSMACYILYRKKKQRSMLALAIVGCILAIASKETALFVPLAFLAYDLVFYSFVTGARFHWKVALPSLLLLAVVSIQTLFRLPSAASHITFNVIQLTRNLFFYLAMQILAAPVAYTDFSITPLSLVAERLAALGLFILVVLLLLTHRQWADARKRSSSLVFCLTMVLVALLPTIFVVTERTAFLSSAFVSLTLSWLFVQAWTHASKRCFGFRVFVIAALVLCVSANTLTLVRRNYWWGQASTASRAVMEQLDEHVKELPSNTHVWLLDLPDHLENAYAFRNAFPKAAQVLGYDVIIHPVLDVELAALSHEERVKLVSQLQDAPDVIVLWYKRGHLQVTQQT
jgi:hypothetical protein